MAKENRDIESIEAQLRAPHTARKAFGEAVRHFTQPLYWQIRRLVNNHDDANDILQNTFLKAWQSVDGFRGDARLSTWLHKIAINESLTHLAKEKRAAEMSVDDPDSSLSNAIEADEWIDGDDVALKLRKAIASLPEKQRLVFNMRYYDDMKYEDISNILGTSVGALKASYHLAAKKIERYFNQED